MDQAAIGICLALNVLELLCFAFIFAEMRVHHKGSIRIYDVHTLVIERRDNRGIEEPNNIRGGHMCVTPFTPQRHVALCLANKPGAARRKKRRNVVTAAGHFVSWVSLRTGTDI